MLAKDVLLKVLRIYHKIRIVGRTEVGHMIGEDRNRIAGLCYRNGLQPWPLVPDEIKPKRTCCFLVTPLSETIPRLCCKPHSPTSTYLCEDHEKLLWTPNGPVPREEVAS